MAKRPVFMAISTNPFFKEEMVEFKFYSGFSKFQQQKSIKSLHEAFLHENPNKKVLEISSKSEIELGNKLSAFNIMIETKSGIKYSVENAFQSSKVFEYGGPFIDLMDKTSKEAKKDPRLKSSGKLKSFHYGNRNFELTPTTYFYNWLYINALNLHLDIAEQLLNYDAFTDIVFNPEKSINCQAMAAAIYVSLSKNKLLETALKDEKSFLDVVYGDQCNENSSNTHEQISF
jgi:type I restriction enzyme M protein